MSGLESIARLLKPRSVAVIGASADAAKTAGRPVAYLRKHGFTGDIYPVNPRVHAIDACVAIPILRPCPACRTWASSCSAPSEPIRRHLEDLARSARGR